MLLFENRVRIPPVTCNQDPNAAGSCSRKPQCLHKVILLSAPLKRELIYGVGLEPASEARQGYLCAVHWGFLEQDPAAFGSWLHVTGGIRTRFSKSSIIGHKTMKPKGIPPFKVSILSGQA